jgi:hypothetical protein
MLRTNPYEMAFESYLRHQGIGYISVDESRRPLLDSTPLKSLDYIVFTRGGSGLLVDVKGRRFPAGSPRRPRRAWESWCTLDDVAGLESWGIRFGPGYLGLLVFTYCVAPEIPLTPQTCDLWEWRGGRYLFRAVRADQYRSHMRVRSPRWHTVDLPDQDFRDLVRPLSFFTGQPQTVSTECPF